MSASASPPPRTPVEPSSIRVLRLGHGANCSSIGSVVDTLFVTALLGGAVFAAIVAGLAAEPIEVVGPVEPPNPDPLPRDRGKGSNSGSDD